MEKQIAKSIKIAVIATALIFGCSPKKEVRIEYYQSSTHYYVDVWLYENGVLTDALSNGYYHKEWITFDSLIKQKRAWADELMARRGIDKFKFTIIDKHEGLNEFQRKLLNQ